MKIQCILLTLMLTLGSTMLAEETTNPGDVSLPHSPAEESRPGVLIQTPINDAYYADLARRRQAARKVLAEFNARHPELPWILPTNAVTAPPLRLPVAPAPTNAPVVAPAKPTRE